MNIYVGATFSRYLEVRELVVAPFKYTVFWDLPNVTVVPTVFDALYQLEVGAV